MKALRTKVILSAFVLLFALVATIGSTFAWFTVSTTVEVPALTLNVKSSKSLLIRPYYGETGVESYLDVPTNYKTNLLVADITTVDPADPAYTTIEGDGPYQTSPYAGISSWTLNNVTAIQSLAPTMVSPNLNGTDLQVMDVDTKVLSDSLQSNLGSATGDFIELRFWLYSQLTSEAIVLQDLAITGGDTADAISVAVFVSGASQANIYSVDPDYGFVFTLGSRGYDGDATDSILTADKTTLLGEHDLYYNSLSADDVQYESVGTTTGLSGATTITTLTADTPTLMVVRVYLEGWDAETTNDILASSLTIAFNFSLKNAI